MYRKRPILNGRSGVIAAIALIVSAVDFTGAAEQKPKTAAPQAPTDRRRHFDAQIAPLLGRHCVECHGPAKKKGRLDLSRRDAALAGGKSGRAILPGQAVESLLWKKIESDEMPEDRPPLSAPEKKLLREWIEAGAIWSANPTAPMAHVPDRAADNHWLRRLTVPEYIETVRSAVGVEIEPEARQILPHDLRADGFHNTAYNLNIDLAHVEAYARLSQIIVGRMNVPAFAADYSPCQKLSDDCLRRVIAGMGKWLLRGPLEEREVTAFLGVAKAVAKTGGDFKETVRYVLEAMLQSPRFLYRIEYQRPRAEGKMRPRAGYELASRLSYILWGGPPDKELMRAAEAGELSRRSQVEAQVRRMLKDPRAVARSSQFIYEWLDLDRLNHLRPDAKKFPKWDARLATDMREETLAFFRHVAWEQQRPLVELMNARVAFATPRLAAYYGLRPNLATGASPDGLLALYTFEEGTGDTVRDVSGGVDPMNLRIEDASAIQWRKGQLTVKQKPVLIATADPPKRLIDAVKKSQAITLEAWITPASANQKGPARILTLSSGASQRNFTLGQQEGEFDVRFRTTKSDDNGQPSLSSSGAAVVTRLTHVVFTRDAAGKAKLYVDGENKGARDLGGDLSNWDAGFRLALANETTKDRPWQGTFHRVAIYGRALTPDEIRARGEVLSRYDLGSAPGRGGLLTQGSVLTVGGDNASMVTRGLFVLRDFLWAEVDDPPPGVDTTPVPTKPGLSQRAIAEGRLANSSCGGCHAKFEPFAFGLERFDGLGAYHEQDAHGNKLRDDGTILFPGSEQPVSYQSSAELRELLAKSERVRRGITRKLAQFALGRPLVEADEPILDGIDESAQKGGGTYASVITAIVLSDLVQRPQTSARP